MNKNIIILLDGTWNDKKDNKKKSNVALLDEMCIKNNDDQLKYYDTGVGTAWYDKKIGGFSGLGLSKNIIDAYVFLSKNYEENDKVFIFGFSRGAYSARSLAGFIYKCGLPEKYEAKKQTNELYDLYQAKNNKKMNETKLINRKCPIHMIGVWDTVGALGIPVLFLKNVSDNIFSFHDTTLNPEVKFAYHAIAIDEKREAFSPTLWDEKNEEDKNRITQVWFSGVHSDIGGGYKERHHSDISLKWMSEQAESHGVKIKSDYQYQIDISKSIHNEDFKIDKKIFGKEMIFLKKEREAKVTGFNTPTVHKSVLEKVKKLIDYNPIALMKHIVKRETLEPYNIEK